MNARSFNAKLTVGFVGHVPVEHLNDVKRILEELHYFDIVFFKTSSGKLWLKEGDANDESQR